MTSGNLYVYQIYYDQATKEALDPGFIPLENDSSLNKDWFEYPAILKALNCRNYHESDLIGVLSPRFFEKTSYTSTEVKALIKLAHPMIYNFSPIFDSSALYLNPWHQGEQIHSGLTLCFNETIRTLGFSENVDDIVLDSKGTIFSNYFVAPYYMWREWQKVVQDVMELCEGSDPLAQALNSYTLHRNVDSTYRMRIFVLERMISFLIFKKGWVTEHIYEPQQYLYSGEVYQQLSSLVISCDLLKAEFIVTKNKYYLDKWMELRGIIAQLLSRSQISYRTRA